MTKGILIVCNWCYNLKEVECKWDKETREVYKYGNKKDKNIYCDINR